MLSCCLPSELNRQTDLCLQIGKSQKHFSDTSPPKTPSSGDVVDNPNRWKSCDVSLENPSLFDSMKCEKNRWDSFDKKWPLQFISVSQLVKSGFFYLQSDDKVQCAFCKLVLCSWKDGDVPLKEHIKISPKCPFLIKGGNASAIVLKSQQFFPFPKEYTASINIQNKPKNPRMIDLKMRLLTFKNWPHATIKVKDLAECGLYYTGVQDVVTCFYCGGSLSNWEPSDEPVVEHAKFYPKCNYLRIIQSRPVYKKVKSTGSNAQTGGNLSSNPHQSKEILKSDIVLRAKEIFPSSMVEEVVVQHMQEGETFSSLHHLCEKLLEKEERDMRFTQREPKMVTSSMDQKPINTLTNGFESGCSSSDILLCKICMDSEREVVFQPCGHLISCEKCAAQITNCPLCRKQIKSRMRTFLS